jgi:hypothetical protein
MAQSNARLRLLRHRRRQKALAARTKPAIEVQLSPVVPASPVASPSPGRMKSFRDWVIGVIDTFLKNEGMRCEHTQDGLVEAVVALARYQEEGVALYPKIVICDDIDDALKQTTGSEAIQLGEGPRKAATVAEALKKCAPLARDRWIAYVHRKPDTFSFGIFRENSSPVAVALRDAINGSARNAPVGKGLIFVTQLAENVIELVGARGDILTLHLNAAPDDRPSPTADIERLAGAATQLVDNSEREAVAGFLRSLFVDAFRHGHGSLIAVVGKQAPRALTNDAVALAPPLDLAEAVRQHRLQASEKTVAQLRDYKHLLEGMLGSDGITVITRAAVVTHFRVFVKVKEGEGPGPGESGGARLRAFAALCRLVDGGQLVAAYKRSADGGSAFQMVKNGK